MLSPLPKVLHEMGGKPLLFHVLKQVHLVAPHASVGVVVGHGREQVETFVRSEPGLKGMNIEFILQSEQRGTGHAARCALDSAWGEARVREKAPVLVLPGDLPLISSDLIRQMLAPLNKRQALRLLTCELPEPTGYGRVVRRAKSGPVLRIVEEKDASPKEKDIREVAASIYLFQSGFLQVSLRRLSNLNAQGEYYLTDLVSHAVKAKKEVDVLRWKVAEDLRGVNDPWELAQASQIMNERINRAWSRKGVKFIDPWTTRVDVTVQLEEGVTLYPGTILMGTTRLGKGVTIGSQVVLKNVWVGDHATVKTGTVAEQARIGEQAQVGPYAHLRPDADVGAKAKIGNFVEIKNSKIGESTSVAHLSYVGDAEVGRNVNIGCGFVTCNFDGRIIDGKKKHKTIIEDEVFLGSDCQAVAPLRIGKGAFIASGSTLTENVGPGDLAIARSRQVNKPGYAKKFRKSE